MKSSHPAGGTWTLGGHLWLYPCPIRLPSTWLGPHPCVSLAAHLWDFHHCDLSPPLLWFPGPRCFWPPLLSWTPCWEHHLLLWLSVFPLPILQPPPQAVLHLIPCLWAPGVGASSVPATPSLSSPRGQGVLFCFVLFPPRVPPWPSSCHFERKSSALGLNKTNKLTNILKSQVWVKNQSKTKLNSGEHFFCYRICAFYSQPPTW